ncbi:MAG: hypothetical protein AAFV25_19795 [Bacteroidota bacterium]
MKTIICLTIAVLLGLPLAHAQNNLEKTIPLDGAAKIEFGLTYGDVHIKTWDKNEVLIRGKVDINNGENNDAFVIESERQGKSLQIETHIPKIDDLPRIKWRHDEDDKSGKSSRIYQSDGNQYAEGVRMDIDLEVFIPKNTLIEVESTYGDVSLVDPPTPLEVHNTYGSVEAVFHRMPGDAKVELESTYSFVDIGLPAAAATQVELQSSYGEIFTDFELSILKYDEGAHGTGFIKANLNGGGSSIAASATYSNIYLRMNQ